MNYYLGVNKELRNALLATLKERGISQAELARRAGVPRQNISRALTADEPQGKLPPIWEKMLDALELQLSVAPKPADPTPTPEER